MMQALSIPSLEPDLAISLETVIYSKQYRETFLAKWSSDILPKLIDRIEQIQEMSSKSGERYSKRPRGIDLPQSISKAKNKIVNHLRRVFLDKPPFTIQRIAEIILHPEQEGYVLSSNTQMLKYFNSLSKLVVVASSIFDYPEVTFENPTLGGSKAANPPTNQSVQTIPLVEIPWLKGESPVRENSSNGNNLILDPMLISPPPVNQEENIRARKSPGNGCLKDKSIPESAKSPSRRRREKDTNETYSEPAQEYAAKRARTEGKPSPCKTRRNELDDNEDKMDISNSTLEEIIPNKNESPINSQDNNADPLTDDHDTTDCETVLTNKDRDIDNDNKMDISSENLIVSDEEPLVY